jgi:hypothetical protein
MSCYDMMFLKEVLQTIEEFTPSLQHYTEFVRDWYNEIRSYCEMTLRLNHDEVMDDYLNTPYGEMVSSMIYQYRFDREFTGLPITNRLCELADQRDSVIHSVIQNHQDQNHRHFP